MEGGLLARCAIDRARMKTKFLFLIHRISSSLEKQQSFFLWFTLNKLPHSLLMVINPMWFIYTRLKVKATQLQLGNYSHSLSFPPSLLPSLLPPSFSLSSLTLLFLSQTEFNAIQSNTNLSEKSLSAPDPTSYLLQVH